LFYNSFESFWVKSEMNTTKTKLHKTTLFLFIIFILYPFVSNLKLKAQNLEVLIQEALQNNPQLKAKEKRWEAAKAMIPQAGAWMDPMLSFEGMSATKDIGFTKYSFMQKKIGLSQQFPFPGKLGLKKKMAGYDASMMETDYQHLKNMLISEVKMTYYELFFVNKAKEITEKNKALLSDIAKSAETKYMVGQGLQQDVLSAHLELSKLDQKLIDLKREETQIQLKLKTLLFRSKENPPIVPEEVKKTEFVADREKLKKEALEKNPMLREQKYLVDQSQASYKLAKKEYFPDFELTLKYGQDQMSAEVMGKKNFIEAMVGFNLPIYFFQKQNKMVEEKADLLSSAQESFSYKQNELINDLEDKISELKRNSDLLDLFGNGILPQAQQSFQPAQTAYQVNKIDFQTLLFSLSNLYEYEMNYYMILAEHQKSLAELEVIIGKQIPEIK
jgi:cobalt-zinc-cadmium efflux system outer membrane protein